MNLVIPTKDYSVDAIASVYPYCDWHENVQYFGLPPGHDHYWLLSEIARQLPNGSCVLDVGTYLGFSAVAFSSNANIQVVTVDVVDCIGQNLPKLRENIKFLIDDDILGKLHLYVHCPVIMLDTNHEGTFEREFIAKLEELNYKGIVICDDIYLNKEMLEFWLTVKQEKLDVTRVGHFTGTGVILFDKNTVNLTVQQEEETDLTVQQEKVNSAVSE